MEWNGNGMIVLNEISNEMKCHGMEWNGMEWK
jgi:hypothetical protein